jgi:two-component system, cell cycle sensor histidine kinase DivJ
LVATEQTRPYPDPALPGLAAWHAGWAVGVAVLALALRWLGGESGPAFWGLLASAVPGLMGLTLLWRDGEGHRLLILGVWSAAAVVAALLGGGVGGDLAGLMVMPVAAGLSLGGGRRFGLRMTAVGVGGAALAVLVGLAAAVYGVDPPTSPILAASAGLAALGAFVLSLRLGWRATAARLVTARGGVKRVESVLAGQPGLTLIVDPSGKPVAAYGAAPAALPIEPLFESGLFAAVHAPDRTTVVAAIDRALTGATATARFTPRTALDRRVTLLVRRFEDPAATAPRLIIQAFETTADHAREVALDAARAEAEAQNRAKSRFLANMSHELRTPLNAVLGFADIMRQRLFGPLPDRYADYAASIHEAGAHLLDLINDVLDVSKIEAQKYQLNPESLDAREPVAAAMALVRTLADERGVKLTGVLPPEPLTVTADRRALKQMALNLLSNAVKFTPPEGSVTVTLGAIGPYLELVVSDTGAGISPEDLKRLGRPFEQAGDGDQRARGTGLGLSLVRSLAELHGGRLTLDSTLGEGTAATVRLPVAAAVSTPPPEGGAEIVPLPQRADR